MHNYSLAGYLKELKKDASFNSDFINLSEEELSIRVGISETSFHKNYTTKTRNVNRDFIIAVFACQSLGTDDINDFISNYDDNMALISDDEDACERDKTISEILESNFGSKQHNVTSEYINSILLSRGLKELDLKLVNKKRKKSNYVIIDTKLTISNSSTYNLYDSLESEYALERFFYNGKSLIKNKKNNKFFELSYYDKSNYTVIPITNGEYDFNDSKSFKNIEETGEYRECFNSLCTSAIGKTNLIKNTINDTKNYIERISARYFENNMHYFIETFNFDMPEINEYYLLELCNGKWKYYVSNKSMFMKYYLNQSDYKKAYGRNKIEIISEYDTKEDIASKITNSNSINNIIFTHRIKYWERLEEKLLSLKSEIKNRKIFIRNLDEIYEENRKDYVCHFYGLDNEFGCKEDEFSYIATKDFIMYAQNESEKKIKIQLKDLYRMFELGIDTIEDVFCIINSYKKIDNIL